MNRFIKALKVFDIQCSHEWLMYGRGPGPEDINQLEMSNKDLLKKLPLKSHSEEGQTARIAEELNGFLQWNKDAIHYVVPDDAMEPRFVAGEIVAGIRRYDKDIEKLIGQDCVVLIEGGDLYLRTIRKGNLPGYYHLAHTNLQTTAPQPFLPDVRLVSAAPVIWTRRKDPNF